MATYTISNVNDLQNMWQHLTDDCVLVGDIDAEDTKFWNPNVPFPNQTYYEGFIPISTKALREGVPLADTRFKGTFDGQGFTISKLYINQENNYLSSGGQVASLFGVTEGAINGVPAPSGSATNFVRNVTLEDVIIKGNNYTGGINSIRQTYMQDMKNVRVTGLITFAAGSVTFLSCGGLTSQGIALLVENCTFDVTIERSVPFTSGMGNRFAVGGFAGRVDAGTYRDCSGNANIILDVTTPGGAIGGFHGSGIGSSTATFERCSVTSNIQMNSTLGATQFIRIGGFRGGYTGGVSTKHGYFYCWAKTTIGLYGPEIPVELRATIGGFAGNDSVGSGAGINECFAIADIDFPETTAAIAGGVSVGGMVGTGAGGADCWCSGNILINGHTGTVSDIGGYGGRLQSGTPIRCYSLSRVYQSPYTTTWGGFIGVGQGPGGVDCHFDIETSGTTKAIGNIPSPTGVEGNTTFEMKTRSTYESSWDFDVVWLLPVYIRPPGPASSITVWFSVTGDYDNFDEGTLDSDAFSVVLPTTNDIQWLASLEDLVVGTAAGEWIIRSNGINTQINPTNFSVRRQTTFGSKRVQAFAVNDAILHVDFVGRKVRELSYSEAENKYASNDLAELAEHITESGIVETAHQKNPESILWSVLDNGTLLSLMYNREQQIIAWGRHNLAGSGEVQSVLVAPLKEEEDEVWISVKRNINGSPKVFIEKFAPREWGTDIEDAYLVDAGIQYDGAAVSTITGLNHLIGETVGVWGDGRIYDEQVVNGSGNIPIELDGSPETVEKAQVGLLSEYIFQPTRIVLEDENTTFGLEQRINDLLIRFDRSIDVDYGKDLQSLYPVNFPDDEVFSGDIKVAVDGGFTYDSPIVITGNGPGPCSIMAIIADLDVTG